MVDFSIKVMDVLDLFRLIFIVRGRGKDLGFR